MTFEQWWDRLTQKEQTMIGLNNAKFVWNEAQKELKLSMAKEIEQMPFGNTSQSFSAWVRNYE
jgi:hypothetical protein